MSEWIYKLQTSLDNMSKAEMLFFGGGGGNLWKKNNSLWTGPGLFKSPFITCIAYGLWNLASHCRRKSWFWVLGNKVLRGAFKNGKTIPITDCGGPWVCETSGLPHFLESRLKDGGEVVSLTCRTPFTLQEDSWYSFLLEVESTPGL
jgi:hypothetical protein